jgi:hypothetical protein
MLLNTDNLPTFLTVAIFTAILIQDLILVNYKYMLGHFLFGLIAVLLMMYLVDSNASYVAYGVLLLPFILLLLGWSIDSVKKASGETAPLLPPPTPRSPCGCGRCRSCPCICQYPKEKKAVDASGAHVDVSAPPPSSGSTSGKGDSTSGKGDGTTSQKNCGPHSTSGKTQCLNTNSLTSV